MKTNEAPEKIYLSKDLFRWSFGKASDRSDIEYIRTDAFIEKAEKYLENQFINDVFILAEGIVNINFSTAIRNFVNYIKEK